MIDPVTDVKSTEEETAALRDAVAPVLASIHFTSNLGATSAARLD